MNKLKIAQLKRIALRTILILEMVEKGKTERQIVEKVGCSRQLVQYYQKITKD